MPGPYPIVEVFESVHLGVALSTVTPGDLSVIETPERLRPRLSYSFVHAAVLLALDDGRRVLSVPPGAGEVAAQVLRSTAAAGLDPLSDAVAALLAEAVEPALLAGGLAPVNRHFADLVFACGPADLRRHHHGDLRRLRDESIAPVAELALPTHCFPDGTVYGIVDGGHVVAVAYAHRIGEFEDRLADLGVVTAYAWRRQGYAQTVVSAVAADLIDRGGEARYSCQPDNHGSAATARSCGFQPWARSLILAAAAPEGDE